MTHGDRTIDSTTAPTAQAPTSQCLVSFGSNLGDRNDLVALAARSLAASPLVNQFEGLRTSRLFETPPIGGPDGQAPFLNAIGVFDTQATAREILDLLQQLELELGRERHRRWDARSIDLDVVLHGELVGGGTGLIVPHPRYTARQFVLQPACDVAASYRDPRFGWTLQRLTQHISAGVPSLALVGGDVATRTRLCQRLTDEHGIKTFAADPIVDPMPVVGNVPAPTKSAPANSAPASSATSSAGSAAEQTTGGELIEVIDDQPWVSAYLPALPALDSLETSLPSVPRLVARLQWTTPATEWPAPHQLWPSGWCWPEYRLEVDDMDWAVKEVVSALQSMRCPMQPTTEDGNWW